MLITLLLTVIAQTASAPTPAPTPTAVPASKPKAAATGKGLVCVTDTNTGSRLGSQRICHTQAEWDQYRHDMANNVDRRSIQTNVPQ